MLLYSSMIFTGSLRLFFVRISVVFVKIGNKKCLVFFKFPLQNPVVGRQKKTQDVKGGFFDESKIICKTHFSVLSNIIVNNPGQIYFVITKIPAV